MRLSRTKPSRASIEVVITSMLDINFLLILFFIVTAHFQSAARAPLDLPKEKGDEKAAHDESGLVINISAQGQLIVSNRTVGLDELRSLVTAEVKRQPEGGGGPVTMMVRADQQAGTGELNEVLAALRELGVGTIRLATEVPR